MLQRDTQAVVTLVLVAELSASLRKQLQIQVVK